MTTENKSPIEQAIDAAVDAFVYAPIGLLFEGPALLPKLVEKGKSQVEMARVLGEFAVQAGQGEAGKAVAKAQAQVRDLLGSLGIAKPAPAAEPQAKPVAKAAPAPAPAATPEPAPAAPVGVATTPATAASPAEPAEPAEPATSQMTTTAATPTAKAAPAPEPVPILETPAPDAASLAIPDYDSLSASQVVLRLAGLSPDELDQVARYESQNRARKTILGKVGQLQKG